MKLNANQLRSIISETVKASKRRRLGEGPVPPANTTLSSRSHAAAVMEDRRIQDAMDSLSGALVDALTTVLGGDELFDGSDVEGQVMTGFQNELHEFVEQWAESYSSP